MQVDTASPPRAGTLLPKSRWVSSIWDGGDVPFSFPCSRNDRSDVTLKEDSDLYIGLQLREGES